MDSLSLLSGVYREMRDGHRFQVRNKSTFLQGSKPVVLDTDSRGSIFIMIRKQGPCRDLWTQRATSHTCAFPCLAKSGSHRCSAFKNCTTLSLARLRLHFRAKHHIYLCGLCALVRLAHSDQTKTLRRQGQR